MLVLRMLLVVPMLLVVSSLINDHTNALFLQIKETKNGNVGDDIDKILCHSKRSFAMKEANWQQ